MDEKILIVDDDQGLQSLLTEYLTGYGYRVLSLYDGPRAVETVEAERPDLVILDIMMPSMTGLEVLTRLRAASRVPVLMLTAKGEDADRIVGLEMGADDYLPKPFNPRELVARMKAILRRAPVGGREDEDPAGAGDSLEAAGLKLDLARRTLEVDGVRVGLSATEYRIMEALMSRPGRVFNRDELMQRSRGRDAEAFDRSVDVHISNLRAKLREFDGRDETIETVWGMGYRLREEA